MCLLGTLQNRIISATYSLHYWLPEAGWGPPIPGAKSNFTGGDCDIIRPLLHLNQAAEAL